LHLAVWGGRRYALLAQLDAKNVPGWIAEMQRICCAALEGRAPRA
jgi:hypothetical protein